MRSLPRQGSIPARLVRAIGPVAQDAFRRLDARHRCRTGLARARCSLPLARPTPVHPRRSTPAVTQRGRPVLPVEGRCRPAMGRCLSPTSATDPQHVHPRTRWTPCLVDASRRLLGAGGDPVDAVPPASAAHRRPPSGGERRFRAGAAPRPASSPDHRALHATSAAPCHPEGLPLRAALPAKDRLRLTLVKGRCLSDPERLRRQSPPRDPLSPISRRLLPTSAITTAPEHEPRTSRFPARPAGGLPPARRMRAAARLSTCDRPRRPDPGAGGGLSACQLLPDDPCRREAFPRIRTARAPPVTSPCPPPAGAAGQGRQTRLRWTLSRPPSQGCFTRPPATEDEIRAPEVPSIEKLPREVPGSPQVVSSLWIPGTVPFLSSRPRSQGRAHDVVATRVLGGHRPKPHPGSAAPLSISTMGSFFVRGPDVPQNFRG